MKKMKRLVAILLTMAMVLGMSLTAFADTDTATPKPDDYKEVKINNVEVDSVVTAYQIIDATYGRNNENFTGYVWAKGTPAAGQAVTFTENKTVNGLTSKMITTLARDTSELEKVADVTAEATTVEIDLTVGTWMILVTPKDNAEKVYNPMIVSVYYAEEHSGDLNHPVAGKVDASKNWTLETIDAYAKSSDLDITKVVDDKEFEVNNDTATFTVTTMIPSYSEEYTDVKFDITDTIINGLAYTNDEPVVSVGGKKVEKDKIYTYSKGINDNKQPYFKISFISDYIKELANTPEANRKVEIKYTATITAEAIEKIGHNKVAIDYTREPGDDTGHKEADEYVYTFELDGVLKKVDEKGKDALSGAKFALYRDKDLKDIFGEYTTETDGNIKFEGLDADETYYLKEIEAPAGYTINDTVYEITFTDTDFTYDNEGKMTGYTVNVKNLQTENKVSSVISYGTPAVGYADTVMNTKIVALPSTGGIGTTIFTIVGCLIMVAAVGMFFVSRRRENI